MTDSHLASRTYSTDEGKKIRAFLSEPRPFPGKSPDKSESDWYVTVTVEGLDRPYSIDIGGADAIQALALACSTLEAVERSEGLDLATE